MPMITSRFSIFWTYGLIPGPPTALSWRSGPTCGGRHRSISKGRISIAAGSTQVCWSPVGHARTGALRCRSYPRFRVGRRQAKNVEIDR